MKINYVLNDNNEIVSWSAQPFDPNKPSIKIDDNTQIYLKCSQIVGGRFIQNADKYEKNKKKHQMLFQKKLQINALSQYLNSTDYIIIKDYEGLITSEEDKVKLQEVKAKRAEARAEINKLRSEIDNN